MASSISEIARMIHALFSTLGCSYDSKSPSDYVPFDLVSECDDLHHHAKKDQ